jgi:F0F1-type ATP synthase membrane subunit b/b'
MPHLDLTYFFNQCFWCIFIFLLVYFTAGKQFFLKYTKILKNRKDLINDYINKSKEILEKAKYIEEQIEKSKRALSNDIQEQEKNLRKKIFNIKNERLIILKKDIENKNLAHKIFLNKLKENLAQDFNQYSDDIKEKINSYLLEK